MNKLKPENIRSNFPALQNEWIYMDNAGGTQVARQVGERLNDYLYNTNVQLGATYDISVRSGKRVEEAQHKWAEVINAQQKEEVVFGSSTSQLLKNLSKSLVQTFQPGDEVIVTDSDHEANVGPWMEMEKHGIKVKVWKINTESLKPELDDLKQLLTGKTRLLAFTHVSNILGTINPVKEITEIAHANGTMVCVDGVAATPHRLPDMQLLDVDFYVFSLYKVFGPHYSLLYGKKQILDELPGINHFFIDETPYKLQPGNVNYELSYSLLGILDYLKALAAASGIDAFAADRQKISALYVQIADYEEELGKPLIDFLKSNKDLRIIGEASADKTLRVPTVSFVSGSIKSSEIPAKVDSHKIGIRWGDFYARRLIESLGLQEQDGVVRVSLVHYNTKEEVDKLIAAFNEIL